MGSNLCDVHFSMRRRHFFLACPSITPLIGSDLSAHNGALPTVTQISTLVGNDLLDHNGALQTTPLVSNDLLLVKDWMGGVLTLKKNWNSKKTNF